MADVEIAYVWIRVFGNSPFFNVAMKGEFYRKNYKYRAGDYTYIASDIDLRGLPELTYRVELEV